MNTNTYYFNGSITPIEFLTVTIAKSHVVGVPKLNGIGYFPSSSINGALRHALLDKVIEMRGGDDKLTLEECYALGQGYISNNEVLKAVNRQGTSIPVDKDQNIRDANPMLSIFGRWGLEGKLGVGQAYCSDTSCVETFERGFRVDQFSRNPERIGNLAEGASEQYERIKETQKLLASGRESLAKTKSQLIKKMMSLPDEEKASIRKQIRQIEADIDLIKEIPTEAKESIQRPIDSLEVIKPETKLNHRMCLKRASVAELGAALHALGQFSMLPKLGGYHRSNFGLVQCEWEVSVPTKTYGRKKIGLIKIDDDGFTVEGDLLEEAMEAFSAGDWDFGKIV
ncbi:TPA: hypothetical protein I7730_00305 [Vibrio vulnificus]|uniref:CRISPR type III-associated protein domain-containing protein n=1 Tax=Vibrio vulnificus TaxID=672 RepID=A0A8H9K568_VIBVL|nr:hypothetical protein [Vibrio vulnificus]HAS8538240.1 hypothetical protein [Vibrio vulnificus]